MKRITGWLKGLLGLGALAVLAMLLIALFGRAANRSPDLARLGQIASPVGTLAASSTPSKSEVAFQSPVETPTPLPTPTPWPTVTPKSTSTIPPVPTPLPTPVATPIPTAVPPIIPEVVGKVQQPFWFIYWQDNQVWRVDSQGKEREMLFDTYEQLGQWLTDVPDPYKNSDCCLIGQRVVVSPDGQKLALVVVDKIKGSKGDKFTFSIYMADIPTRDLKRIDEGVWASWSPDSQHIAFLKDRGLWIADLETNQTYLLAEGDPGNPSLQIEYCLWSPDSQRVAYRYTEGMASKSEIWIKSIDEPSLPYQVPGISEDFFVYDCTWTPDGQHLMCDHQDWASPEQPVDIWSISIKTGERKQLTNNLAATLGPWSPDRNWLAFSAIDLYTQKESLYDTWLLSADGTQLKRITSAPPQSSRACWSPDGTRLILKRENIGLATLSLQTGELVSFDMSFFDIAQVKYAIGGVK